MNRRYLITAGLATTIGAAASMIAANQPSIPRTDGRLAVATTVGMIADLVMNIGGDAVNVRALMGPGVDPHSYRPAANDVETLGDADLILYGGLHLEGRMAETFAHIAESSGIPTDAVSESLPPDRIRHVDGAPDPHVWFDVRLWSLVAEHIRDLLAAALPAHHDDITANANTFIARLADLDAWVAKRIDTIPAENRMLVTAHDAFGYFGDRYGIDVLGVQGMSSAAEASARDIQSLADLIAERQVPAIFLEATVPPATIDALRAAVDARGWTVTIGGELYADALGPANTPDGTYIGMIRHNVTTISHALTETHDA